MSQNTQEYINRLINKERMFYLDLSNANKIPLAHTVIRKIEECRRIVEEILKALERGK